MNKTKRNKRRCNLDDSMTPMLRIWHRKQNKKTCAHYMVKCGCCDNSIEIYYDADSLEINGVNASITEWRRLLAPLMIPKEQPE